MQDTKLTKLMHDTTFWLMLLLSAPGIVTAARDIWAGHALDTTALAALPIVVYLGIGRQVARKGAAIGAGHILAAQSQLTNPPAEEGLDLDAEPAGNDPRGAE